MNYPEWFRYVDELFYSRYCVSWEDCNGDPDDLVSAWESGETAGEFVERYAEKYDLIPV